MKKQRISYEEAVQIFTKNEGRKKVRCQVSERDDDFTYVRNLKDLQDKKRLEEQGIQKCKLFSEVEELPKGAIQIPEYDQAIKLIVEGVKIFCQQQGEEKEIVTTGQLYEVVRKEKAEGGEPLLYWRENHE